MQRKLSCLIGRHCWHDIGSSKEVPSGHGREVELPKKPIVISQCCWCGRTQSFEYSMLGAMVERIRGFPEDPKLTTEPMCEICGKRKPDSSIDGIVFSVCSQECFEEALRLSNERLSKSDMTKRKAAAFDALNQQRCTYKSTKYPDGHPIQNWAISFWIDGTAETLLEAVERGLMKAEE